MTPPDMTLRDWFAGQVASGIHAMGHGTVEESAREAYEFADALLRAREVPSAVPTLDDKQNASSGQADGKADDLAALAVILGQYPGKTFTITSTDNPVKPAGSPAPTGSVFEVVDATGDEIYWPLGIWPTLSDAIASLEGCDDPNDFGCHDHDDHDECCVVEIRERGIGWSGEGKAMATLRWTNRYDESTDEIVWRRESPNAQAITDRPVNPQRETLK